MLATRPAATADPHPGPRAAITGYRMYVGLTHYSEIEDAEIGGRVTSL